MSHESDFSILAISPIDGRYCAVKNRTGVTNYFSEYGYIKYRVKVEVEYLIHISSYLPECKQFFKKWICNSVKVKELENIYKHFTIADAHWVKEKEYEIKHDVKAIELYVRKELIKMGLDSMVEFIHFGLTSQDINTTGLVLSICDFLNEEWGHQLFNLVKILKEKGKKWKTIPMLARTHGQPATPTTLGKELLVFVERIAIVGNQCNKYKFTTKCGGATGNLNAHAVAYPELDWPKILNHFVKNLGLERERYTTQVSTYDNLCGFFHCVQRMCSILIDFCRDMWIYISYNYFKQIRKTDKEIGSSTMPHKINPIQFENAEGNAYIALGLSECITRKLARSRLQRDLTDSTILRNIGVLLSHVMIAFTSIEKAIERIEPNEQVLYSELDKHPEVILEGAQTILRRHGVSDAYELTRQFILENPNCLLNDIYKFFSKLKIDKKIKKQLVKLTPHNYLGYSNKVASRTI